ncbi:uncharacterized protein FA14DRAFT_26 [Meira miltonrushii]|uniref:NAD(P)-binding domain-containing protein n=1 Tax=Meira miltonrushii TaxID=1280837 RepID=A0A316VK77_9BASI|nr:uncharacterized protein FA14DRAFT_26 [Meira miltonrushii]PWN36431.1 hypothetical protein FA14DRAFT_26 [Meira miltonrushii]
MSFCYAIFGATGTIGSLLMQEILSCSSNTTVHAFCRSREKLLKCINNEDHKARVKIFEGSLDDIELLQNCIKEANVIVLAIAPKGNIPNNHLVENTAKNMIKAVQSLKNIKANRIVLVSSAGTEHRFMHANSSALFLAILDRALFHVYRDLEAAEKVLRANESLIPSTYVKPSALSHNFGYNPYRKPSAKNVFKLDFQNANFPCSYFDFVHGVMEVADEKSDLYENKSVATNSIGKVSFPIEAPVQLFVGLVVFYLPFLCSWIY